MGSRIKTVRSEERIGGRAGRAEIWTTVTTEDGSLGTGTAGAGVSVSEYEPVHLYDGGERLGGWGVLSAVGNVNEIIAPKLTGFEVTHQRQIDALMVNLDATPDKSRLGANATLSTSLAVLRAAASSVGLPVYRYIGGANACTIPVASSGGVVGSTRYGGPAPGEAGGAKPNLFFIAYGTSNFEESAIASEMVNAEFQRLFLERYGAEALGPLVLVSRGFVEDDREILDVMVDAISNLGYKDRIGIYLEGAATEFYDRKKRMYVGLWSPRDKTREDLIEYYKQVVRDYPVIVIEDPLEVDDFEGHAVLTAELGIEIFGDDTFCTNIDRLRKGIAMKACNATGVKQRQAGTVTETMDYINFAHKNGYGAFPIDLDPDFVVGMSTGHARVGPAQRLIEIEKELGASASFLGKAAFKLGSG